MPFDELELLDLLELPLLDDAAAAAAAASFFNSFATSGGIGDMIWPISCLPEPVEAEEVGEVVSLIRMAGGDRGLPDFEVPEVDTFQRSEELTDSAVFGLFDPFEPIMDDMLRKGFSLLSDFLLFEASADSFMLRMGKLEYFGVDVEEADRFGFSDTLVRLVGEAPDELDSGDLDPVDDVLLRKSAAFEEADLLDIAFND